MTTEFLLGPQAKSTDIVVASESAQVVEEAAILYASGQAAMAEQVLLVAVQGDNLIDGGQRPWWMLFDLYQLSGRQAEFDALCISFASKFETSPPSWRNLEAEELLPASQMLPKAAAVPSVAFVGKLDSNIVRLLERVQKLGETSHVLRLEFTRVAEVDPVGCGLLLKILKRLHASQHELVLVGAGELTQRIRAILKVGRRDETEAPWLLLLEILRLLNSEAEFEETSMDYCVTFEVSPPAFDAPKNKVTTAEAGSASADAPAFSMPQVVEGKTDSLLATVASFAGSHDPALIDCARLRRIDFQAAGQLLSSLAPVAAGGRVIEFTEVNHMVAALLDVIGLKDIARVSIRKG
jgi:ABC-type transporter Mla MlaB component